MDASQIRALAADVLGAIAPEADLATVGDDEDLRDALDLDSMDFLNFVIALSERIGRPIAEADAPKLATLRGLVAHLGALQAR